MDSNSVAVRSVGVRKWYDARRQRQHFAGSLGVLVVGSGLLCLVALIALGNYLRDGLPDLQAPLSVNNGLMLFAGVSSFLIFIILSTAWYGLAREEVDDESTGEESDVAPSNVEHPETELVSEYQQRRPVRKRRPRGTTAFPKDMG